MKIFLTEVMQDNKMLVGPYIKATDMAEAIKIADMYALTVVGEIHIGYLYSFSHISSFNIWSNQYFIILHNLSQKYLHNKSFIPSPNIQPTIKKKPNHKGLFLAKYKTSARYFLIISFL